MALAGSAYTRRGFGTSPHPGDQLAHQAVFGSLRSGEPGKDILIVLVEQGLEGLFRRVGQVIVLRIDKPLQHQIKLSHAAPAAPLEPIAFRQVAVAHPARCSHAKLATSLSFPHRRWTRIGRPSAS